MIARLFKSRARATDTAPSIPLGHRVYAIGDVHGCIGQLDRLLAMVDADDADRGPAQTTIVLLGDLVDRGPDSRAVLDRLIRLAAERPCARFVCGNHEEVFLGALGGDRKALRLFCRIGGRETAISYGLSSAEYGALDYDELGARLAQIVPVGHRRFIEAFEDMVVIGDYAFVHAGVRPDVPLDEQGIQDLRWIRETFLDHRGTLERMIVHGHTVSPDVERRPHRIGIDTGAYMSGKLTALGLEGQTSWVLQT